ncbi:NAD-dependent epimerase/dehydratase family protein [Actinomadura hibisca]|uniref:NAD-dependent epimerase/dehydratase family protein n=1 Tax=Actinomadura hibisca TaxID=68565 RepID=UPI000836E385|nr:NAD-dependent epimerase/dehydratase family protein [Actinomadura hibisca]
MRLLILGGTEFVGRAVAEDAVARGWEVTVFHRGRNEPPAGTASLLGQRTEEGGLAALKEGEWDAVVDTWSADPQVVAGAARFLDGRVGRYAYISSRSVYAYPAAPELAEDAPVVEAGSGGYAEDKRGGELAALEVFGDRTLLVRAGLILGPYENIGRLPWWLNRMARGGEVLAPGPRDLALQYIDARDLAVWTLDAIEQGLDGPYDLVSPSGHATMETLLEACVAVTGGDAELCWTDAEKILAAGVQPWIDLPVWLPPGEDHDFMHQANVAKALASGLRCRPVQETVADTWTWLQGIGGTAPQRSDRPAVGLDPEVEARLLD